MTMILQLHQIATEGAIDNDAISGEFRQDDEIVIADYHGQIVHQPPAWQTLPVLMQAYCDFANADHQGDDFIHPIVKAIILHFLLGFIHPFGDGNGRTARALFYWSLQKSGYTHFDYISISRLLYKAPKQYAQSYIDVETDELDMTYFIAYQLTIIDRAINDLQALLSIDQAPQSMPKSVPANPAVDYSSLSIHQYQLLTNTPADQVLTAKQVSNELGISDSTARKLLNELESMGLATTVRNGRGKGYLLVR
ncbi:Fic family protein [Moraxella canis]|nr:Fic family protein [Moraxella canis]